MIARLFADQAATDLCVSPNARIVGKISGRSRQIDVLIEAGHGRDNARRIIVDAKKRRRKIDVIDVEALLGVMNDVGATHSYLVSPVGYTKAAKTRAQMGVSIRIVPVDRLANFDPSTWPPCRNPACRHGRIFWDGYPELSLALRSARNSEEELKTLSFVHYAGKCDHYGLFHVWCTTCDVMLPLADDKKDDCGHRCGCAFPWFWIASIEEDDEGSKSTELHVVLGTGEVRTVDRRGD